MPPDSYLKWFKTEHTYANYYMSAVSLRNSGSARSMWLWKGVWSDLTFWQEYFLAVVLQLIYRFLYVR